MDEDSESLPPLGPEWLAWHALHGDGSLDTVHACAMALRDDLGWLAHKLSEARQFGDAETVSATHLFLIALAELLDPNGISEYKATISRRKPGKPINRHARAVTGHRAASIVMKLVKEGWKQEAAIEQATTETQLSRAEIMSWLAYDRAALVGRLKEYRKSRNYQD